MLFLKLLKVFKSMYLREKGTKDICLHQLIIHSLLRLAKGKNLGNSVHSHHGPCGILNIYFTAKCNQADREDCHARDLYLKDTSLLQTSCRLWNVFLFWSQFPPVECQLMEGYHTTMTARHCSKLEMAVETPSQHHKVNYTETSQGFPWALERMHYLTRRTCGIH